MMLSVLSKCNCIYIIVELQYGTFVRIRYRANYCSLRYCGIHSLALATALSYRTVGSNGALERERERGRHKVYHND